MRITNQSPRINSPQTNSGVSLIQRLGARINTLIQGIFSLLGCQSKDLSKANISKLNDNKELQARAKCIMMAVQPTLEDVKKNGVTTQNQLAVKMDLNSARTARNAMTEAHLEPTEGLTDAISTFEGALGDVKN